MAQMATVAVLFHSNERIARLCSLSIRDQNSGQHWADQSVKQRVVR
jgi:hypothetical protein